MSGPVWREVAGFPRYEVSDAGEVRSWTRRSQKAGAPGVLKGWIDPDGYTRVKLREQGVTKLLGVHRLVATAFHGPPPDRTECSHIDGNRANNAAANLLWESCQENQSRRVGHGTLAQGERCPLARLTADKVAEIRRLSGSLTYAELGRRFGITSNNARYICIRRTWKHVVDEREAA